MALMARAQIPLSIGVYSNLAIGVEAQSFNTSASSAGTMVLGRAMIVPFILPGPAVLKRMWWTNGGTVAGNVDAGVYRPDMTKVATIGLTAQSGASAQQFADMTDTAVPAGLYYMAFVSNNDTATFLRTTSGVANADRGRAVGLMNDSLSGSEALPDPLVPTAWNTAQLAVFGVEVGRLF